MATHYNLISADSHLDTLRPDRWVPHVEAKWRDRAPKLVTFGDGREGFVVENRRIRGHGSGLPHRVYGTDAPKNPGDGSPEQRLQEQDRDGVDAEIMYTHGQMPFWRGTSDDEAYEAVVRGYNQWLAEEYCAVAPDRLVAMGLVPDTGVDAAIAEMEHIARIGLKGVQFIAYPSGKGYPTPEDDRFWKAAIEMKMPLTSHTVSGSTRLSSGTARLSGRDPLFKYPKDQGRPGGDPMTVVLRFVGDQAIAHVQMSMAGVFDRLPDLKICWSETQAGWIAHAMAQMDHNFECNSYLAEKDYGLLPPAKRFSEYMVDNAVWVFLNDPIGVKMRHEVGVDKLLWGSDFPHSATDWPYSREAIDSMFDGVPEDERYRMLAGNAADFFRLDVPAAVPATSG